MLRLGGVLFAALFGYLAAAPEVHSCAAREIDGLPYTICEVDPRNTPVRLFHARDDGTVWGQFDRLDAALRRRGQSLGVAMNAGMYHDDRRPVGHYVEDGVETMRVITSDGPGNFGLLPNGVLCIAEDEVRIVESRAYAAAPPPCEFATQSGPMLVIDGDLHPRFRPDSTSRFVRNGAGVDDDGTLYLAISDRPVTFHEFGRVFRDTLGTPNALYLDGNVSRLWAPMIGRRDPGFAMGPIIGTVVPEE